jgi:acyl carrier protein
MTIPASQGACAADRNLGADMQGKLLTVVADLMDVDPSRLGEETMFETLEAWDSQREVELAILLEHEYKITVKDEEMAHLRSMREVRALLAARGIADP